MPTDPTPRVDQCLEQLGAATSADLQRACATSQPSVSRALAPLLQQGAVLRMGRGKRQTYVKPRAMEGLQDIAIPLTRVDSSGNVAAAGAVIPLVAGAWWADDADGGGGRRHAALPWFLADVRPQGFLGRAFARRHAHLGLPPEPDHWSDDDIARALLACGERLPGDLIVGGAALERMLRDAPAVSPTVHYPALAASALAGHEAGGLLGGAHPKFCATREDGQPVLVKFSPAGASPECRRMADLLVCEHLALATLEDFGVPSVRTRLLHLEGRTMLEVERFDRTPTGRVGVASLLALHSEYVGACDDWTRAAHRLVTRGMLSHRDGQRLVFLDAFGELIGNADRDYANVSVLTQGSGWTLAPAYDMQPSLYAPVGGELVPREFDPGLLAPSAGSLRVWSQAREAAREFWARVALDATVSQEFRALAATHARQLQGPRRVVTGAPAESPSQALLGIS